MIGGIVMSETTTTTTGQVIDARGMACPGPLMSLIGAIRQSQVGAVLEVWSTDQGSATDIPAWVAKARHELLQVADTDGYTRFRVRKAR
jgi:tRNA 2-thiouridine synthesizing protein A